MNGSDILVRAKAHLGERYVLGAHAPLANPNWTGPWDCAEYASWLVYQTYGIVYGCGTIGLVGADPYTGYWTADVRARGIETSVAHASNTPGAFLLRFPVAAQPKSIGHIAVCVGDGTVYEAAGAQLGVRIGPISGRRWDIGVVLPGVDYQSGADPGTALVPAPLIFRQADHPTFDDHVVEAQSALRDRGFDPGKIDGLFGEATQAAVFSFQASSGLVPDGEIGPTTGTLLGLPYWPAAGAVGGAPAPAGSAAAAPPALQFTSDAFGTVVNKSTSYADLRTEYAQLFQTCVVQDRHDEINELAQRIEANRDRYAAFVAGYAGQPNENMPWFFVALIHAMEASGDIGRFKTHLHNGDPLTAPTVHVPAGRPRPAGANFTWEESARDAISYEHFNSESDWSLPRMLFRLEQYNGMGARKRGHATAYLWSYSNHYIKGKYIADNVWDDNAVSRQPGAAAILKQLTTDGSVSV